VLDGILIKLSIFDDALRFLQNGNSHPFKGHLSDQIKTSSILMSIACQSAVIDKKKYYL